MKHKLLLISILTVLVFSACYTYRPQTGSDGKKNLAYMYNPGKATLHPEYKIYHNTDSTSLIFFKLYRNELKYNTSSKEFLNKAKILYNYTLHYSNDISEIADSATYSYTISKNINEPEFISYFSVKTPYAKQYLLNINLSDVFNRNTGTKSLFVDKYGINVNDNFLFTDTKTRKPLFNNFVSAEDTIRINFEKRKINELFVYYFKDKYSIPTPPYSTKDIELNTLPDSSYTLSYSKNNHYCFPNQGLYMLKADSSAKKAATLYNYGSYYNKITDAKEMFEALKYLISEKQYRNLLNETKDHKKALDNYWLKTGGNVGKAKELIRVYYNRMQAANLFFTSYTKGWKTDRGMIYMIFGAPGTIYKSSQLEQWIYGEQSSMSALTFTFEKKETNFVTNHYELQRSDLYKTTWYQAVDTWRNGRIFETKTKN